MTFMEGDVIEKRYVVQKGAVIGLGFPSREKAELFMSNGYRGMQVPYEIVEDELNKGALAVKLLADVELKKQVSINWISGKEAGVSREDGGLEVMELTDEWVLVDKGATRFKEEVSQMSDEELERRISSLRGERKPLEKKIRVRETGMTSAEEKLLKQIMEKLTPEQIKEVLGG